MLRQLRENSLAMAGVALITLGAAGGLLYVQLAPAAPVRVPTERYFYDEASKALIERDGVLAPFKVNESDGAANGVGVHVMSCGSCADESDRFIAYLEKYTPEAQARLAALGMRNYETPDSDDEANALQPGEVLVRRENDSQWVERTGAFLEGVAREAGARCGGQVRNCANASIR